MAFSLDIFVGEKNVTIFFLTNQLLITQAERLNFRVNLNRKLEIRKRMEILYSGYSAHFTVLSSVLVIFSIKEHQVLLCPGTYVAYCRKRLKQTNKKSQIFHFSKAGVPLWQNSETGQCFCFIQQLSPCCLPHLSPFKKPYFYQLSSIPSYLFPLLFP